MNRIIHLLCVAFTLSFVHLAVGQSQQDATFFFDATSIVNDESQFEDQRMAMNLLIGSLEAQGGVKSEKEGWLFIIGISEENDAGYVALSVSIHQKLPETIGINAQVQKLGTSK